MERVQLLAEVTASVTAMLTAEEDAKNQRARRDAAFVELYRTGMNLASIEAECLAACQRAGIQNGRDLGISRDSIRRAVQRLS